jgi:O-antigen/teichoic acid export membrane protein
LSFSGWLTAGQIINTLNWRFDYLLIGKLLDRAALGFYTVGSTLATLPTREVVTPLTQSIYPGFAKIQNDPARLAAGYQRVQALITAISLPAGIGVAIIADPLVRLTLGDKWIPVIFIVQWLASVFAIQTLGSLVQPLAMAKGETRLLFVRDTQMFLVRVPVIALALIFYGLHGVIIARVGTGLLGAFVNMLLVRRLTGLTLLQQLGANSRAFISVAVMAVGVVATLAYLPFTTDYSTLIVHLAILVAIGAVLYCGTSLLLWLIMRRPAGPEREILTIAGKVRSKLRFA